MWKQLYLRMLGRRVGLWRAMVLNADSCRNSRTSDIGWLKISNADPKYAVVGSSPTDKFAPALTVDSANCRVPVASSIAHPEIAKHVVAAMKVQ